VLHAVITAGGRVSGDFARAIGTDVKAMAPLGSRRLIDASIDAARGIGVAAIAVVGGPEVRQYCAARVERVIDASADGTENIRKALRAFPDVDLVYLTSDVPFIDPEGLRDFVVRSNGALVTMPLADPAAYERRFPEGPGELMKLGGERFASGTAFFLAARSIPQIEALAGAFFDARKSPLGLARLCGPVLLLRYLVKRLRVGDVEARASRLFGGPVRAVRGASPGLCYDVDALEDWEYARARV
jgi:hypothetical protein